MPDLVHGPDEVFQKPPEIFELTDEPRGDNGSRFARPRVPSRVPHGVWRIEGSLLKVWWSNGFSGVALEVAPAEEFAGRAETFWDFPRQPQEAKAKLARVPCPDAGRK
jgi:hypothetical protein